MGPRHADRGAVEALHDIVKTGKVRYIGEDQRLTDKLLTELPGILNWAIVGWRRLTERGYFRQPQSALDAVQPLEDLSSPIGAFLRERCVIAAGHTVKINRLFKAWTLWCTEQGRDHPGTAQSFGRNLRAAIPGLKVTQPRAGQERWRFYQEIGLR